MIFGKHFSFYNFHDKEISRLWNFFCSLLCVGWDGMVLYHFIFSRSLNTCVAQRKCNSLSAVSEQAKGIRSRVTWSSQAEQPVTCECRHYGQGSQEPNPQISWAGWRTMPRSLASFVVFPLGYGSEDTIAVYATDWSAATAAHIRCS